MIAVQGKQADLYVFRSGAFVPVACVKTVTITTYVALIETATQDSGPDEDFEGGFRGADIDLEGIRTFDMTSSWQLHEFVTNQRTKQRIKLEWIDSIGNTLTYEMNVLCPTITNTNNQKGYSQFSVSMKRCGSMTETFNGSTGGGTQLGVGFDAVGSTNIVG